jgi:hypothetical protein
MSQCICHRWILPKIRTKSGIWVSLCLGHSSPFLFSPHPIESGTPIKRALSWWLWESPGPQLPFLYDPISRQRGDNCVGELNTRKHHWQTQNICSLSRGCGTSFTPVGLLSSVQSSKFWIHGHLLIHSMSPSLIKYFLSVVYKHCTVHRAGHKTNI